MVITSRIVWAIDWLKIKQVNNKKLTKGKSKYWLQLFVIFGVYHFPDRLKCVHAWFLSGGIVLGDCGPTGRWMHCCGKWVPRRASFEASSPFWFHLPDPLNVIALLRAPSTTTRSYHPPPCFLHCNELFSNCKPKQIFSPLGWFL